MKKTAKLFALTLMIAAGVAISLSVAASSAYAAEKHPFMVTSPLNGQTPFNVTLPSTTEDGKPVKTVAINFVTADCVAAAGTAMVGSAQVTVTFSGQNGFYHLAFEPAQMFPNASEFVMTQQTLMFADPGSTINFGLTADAPTCTVVFSGHLIAK